MRTTTDAAMPPKLPAADLADLLSVMTRVVLPTFGKGVILRRPSMERLAERFALDSRAVKTMQALRRKHGSLPLRLPLPGRPIILLLDPADVAAVLAHTPDPFETNTWEKRAALGHFEPGNVLISDAPRRATLRPLHEAALATGEPVHPCGEAFRRAVEEELGPILLSGAWELDWTAFSQGWSRLVRRLVLGRRAREDQALTECLNELRRRANWAFFRRQSKGMRQRLHDVIHRYLADPDPQSLAARMPIDPAIAPESQIAQWLFAFDPAGMATFRTLSLLAAHPDARNRCLAEADGGALFRPFARQCLMESLRLWPTTPAILRETRRPVAWRGGSLPADSLVLIFTPFFHRDEETFADAHRFAPEIWEGAADHALPLAGLVPFSAGPARCPAHDLVPMIASFALGLVLSRKRLVATAPGLAPEAMPGTLDHYLIRLRLEDHPRS